MKKIFIIFLLLFLLASAALAFFVLTFDADQYRPEVVKRLEQTIGRPVDLARISFGWHQGLALEFSGLVIYKDARGGETLLKLESAKGTLSPAPLLQRMLQVSTIVLERPSVTLILKPDGRIEGLEKLTTSGGSGKGMAALSFLIEGIRIEKAEIEVIDQRGSRVQEFKVRDLDVDVRNVSLTGPVDFKGKAALFGVDQNVSLRGTLRIPLSERSKYLENLHLEANLSKMDPAEIAKWLPAAGNFGSQKEITGQLEADFPSIRLGDKGAEEIRGQIRFLSPHLSLPGFSYPLKDLKLEVSAEGKKIKISQAAFRILDGFFTASGTVNLDAPKPITAVEAKLENFNLKNMNERPDSGEPALEGILNAAFQGTVAGMDAPSILSSLSGIGQIQLSQGVLRNMNLLQEVFRKLSVIPGLVDKLQQRLPQTYQEKLNAQDTYLEDAAIPVSAQQGNILLNQIDIRTDSFRLRGDARADLPRSFLTGRGFILADPDLTAALVESVRELESLVENQESLSIPLIIQGPFSKVSVTPDLQLIGSRLAAYKTQEVLSDLFKKKNAPQDPNAVPGQASPASQPAYDPNAAAATSAKPKTLLGQLLETALQANTAQGTSGQTQQN